MTVRIAVADLGPLTRLDSGGQGVVFAAPRLRMRYASSLVFKQYKPSVAGSLDVSVLESMPTYLKSLAFAAGMELLSQSAWPCRLVDDGTGIIGFVMPAIPDAFFVQMKKSSGMSREVAEFQHLLNDESFLARRQIGLTDRHRYELLREVARALSVFHRHGIAVGDLSPKNLLFACDPDPAVYFIDCDAMRFQGGSVMTQIETPSWEVRAVNDGEELGTAASDSYKLGLLALRLLTGSQDTRDPARLPKSVKADIRQLIVAALSADAKRRPKPDDWIAPLENAAASASTEQPRARQAAATTVTTPLVTVARPLVSQPAGSTQGHVSASSGPVSRSPQPTNRPRRRGRRRVAGARVTAIVIGGALAALATAMPWFYASGPVSAFEISIAHSPSGFFAVLLVAVGIAVVASATVVPLIMRGPHASRIMARISALLSLALFAIAAIAWMSVVISRNIQVQSNAVDPSFRLTGQVGLTAIQNNYLIRIPAWMPLIGAIIALSGALTGLVTARKAAQRAP